MCKLIRNFFRALRDLYNDPYLWPVIVWVVAASLVGMLFLWVIVEYLAS